MPVPITILGLGPVGQALARAFHRARLGELALIGRGRPGERTLARALKARYLPDLHGLRQDRGFIIVCVKDNQITTVSRQLAKSKVDWNRLALLHTSGVLGSEVLRPLASKGAAVAAWHPFMTFPKTSARRAGSVEYQFRRAGSGDSSSRRAGSPTLPESALFRGVTFGTSGDDRGVRAANRLTRALGGRPLRVREEDRVLYHLSAVLACGFVTVNLDMAVRVLKKIGLSEKRALETILPIASQTLKNVAALGPARALTGPATRGDIRTIQKHLRELKKHPQLAKVYRELSRYLLNS